MLYKFINCTILYTSYIGSCIFVIFSFDHYIFYLHILCLYIYIYFFLVCLFISNKRQSGWVGQKCCVGPHMTPGKRFMNDQISKISLQHFFIKSANFFLQCTQREMLTIEIEDECLVYM